MRKLNLRITFHHVEGHQDDDLAWVHLDRAAQLNVAMDIEAKNYLRMFVSSNLASPQRIPYEGWSLWTEDTKITGDIGDSVRQSESKAAFKGHLDRKHQLWAIDFNKVDWEATAAGLRHGSRVFRMWASKQASGFCGVGRMMKIMGFWDNDRCPCCKWQGVVETMDHVLQCRASSVRKAFDEQVEKFTSWLRASYTAPYLCQPLLGYIRGRGTVRFLDLPGLGMEVRRAGLDQDAIGWRNFMEGKISWE